MRFQSSPFRSVMLLLLLMAPLRVHGQSGSTASRVTADGVVGVDRILSGADFQVAVRMHIQEGWHVNSSKPTFDYLIGTSITLDQGSKAIVSDIRYPAGKMLRLAFADQPLSTYDGTITIFMTMRYGDKGIPGPDTLRGQIAAQACSDQVCIAPAEIPVAIPILVGTVNDAVNAVNKELFAGYTPSSESSAASTDLGTMLDERGSFIAFLAIFLIGLALNLTPCVYPMLSVTVSLFGGQSETNILRVFFKAVVYVLGIATMYSVLGVSAALGGGLFGSWLQSPWVLGGIALLLFGLALSSFGLYQIQLPYWVTSRLGGTTGTGLVATYLSGLVVGIFAAPCVGPPVIALLTFVAAKGDPVFGFWAFFTLSIGLGFPYLILGTFSGLLKKVPRSGTWLVWVERIFGVVLVGAALFYLSLAVAPKLAQFVIPLALVAGGIYLGFLEPSGRGNTTLRRIQWLVGTAAIVLGLVFANDLRRPGMTWEKYSAQAVVDARQQGKPVIMDFYADWCIPCMELDRNTFTDPGVIDAANAFVRLKVDLTHFDSPEAEALRREYAISGVPTIVFLRSDGGEERNGRIIGFVPPADVLYRLRPLAPRN